MSLEWRVHELAGCASVCEKAGLAFRPLSGPPRQGVGVCEHKMATYTIAMPMHQRHDLSRTIYRLPDNLCHEAIAEEMRGNAAARVKLREAIEGGELPPAYHNNPVVVAARAEWGINIAFSFVYGRSAIQPHRFSTRCVGAELDLRAAAFINGLAEAPALQMRLQRLVQLRCHVQSNTVVF